MRTHTRTHMRTHMRNNMKATIVTFGTFRSVLPLQVRGGSRVNKNLEKGPLLFWTQVGPKLDSKVGPRKSPKNRPPI